MEVIAVDDDGRTKDGRTEDNDDDRTDDGRTRRGRFIFCLLALYAFKKSLCFFVLEQLSGQNARAAVFPSLFLTSLCYHSLLNSCTPKRLLLN